MKKEELLEMVEEEIEHVIALRREIHMHPELSAKEIRTQELVCNELDRLGIEYQTWPGYTGVVGIIHGKNDGQVIALRADMDALPIQELATELPFCSINNGVMHACGHDVHTAILLGAAGVLVKLKPKLQGKVKLLFQPAEEIGQFGAKKMVELGCMENPKVDKVFGIHVDDSRQAGKISTKYGAVNSSVDAFLVKIRGKASHGTNPVKGVDAVYAACQLTLALYGMLARRVHALDSVSLNIGTITGGSVLNVIPEKAELGISLRTIDNTLRDRMHREIIKLCEDVGVLNNVEIEIELKEGAKAQINDKECVDLIQNVSDLLFNQVAFEFNEHPSMGSEDFSEYCADGTPGGFWQLGVANDELGWNAPLHNGQFRVDERAVPIGVAMQSAIVFKLIGDEALD